jgi:hypothetical protein
MLNATPAILAKSLLGKTRHQQQLRRQPESETHPEPLPPVPFASRAPHYFRVSVVVAKINSIDKKLSDDQRLNVGLQKRKKQEKQFE